MAFYKEKLLTTVPEETWWTALDEIFKVADVEATPQQQKKIFYQIFATMAIYLYNHADCKFRFQHMEIVKTSMSYKNLFNVQLPKYNEIEDADIFNRYYTQGGLELEQLRDVLNDYLEQAMKFSSDLDEEISRVTYLQLAEKRRQKRKKRRK